ncbi:MAG: hypothetical protein U1E27_00120 [Kiritimatiellia bacterium]|nr:hypothetical protein [Kiritimatiellia bacterium]
MDGPVPEPPPETAETLRERIDAAMEIWRIRSDIARDTLLARARFDDRATDQFDLLMAAMNLRLRTEIGKIADQLRTGEIPNQEFSIRSAHVLAGAIATTYDEMDRTLPPSWRVGEERSVDLTDFIDPSVAEPLIAVESRLSIQGRRPGRNRRTP